MRTRSLFCFTSALSNQLLNLRAPQGPRELDLLEYEHQLRQQLAQGALPEGTKIVTVKNGNVLVDVGLDLTACVQAAMKGLSKH
jgi:hypothetical protein